MIARRLLVLAVFAGIAAAMPLDAQRGERGRGGFGAGPPQGPVDISEFKPDRRTGEALNGQLKGQHLQPYLGILAYAVAWEGFYPESKKFPLE